MYQVLDNNKPASCLHFPVDNSWYTSIFKHYEDAIIYTHKWLGIHYPGIDELYDLLVVDGSSLDYSGYGDIIRIISFEK